MSIRTTQWIQTACRLFDRGGRLSKREKRGTINQRLEIVTIYIHHISQWPKCYKTGVAEAACNAFHILCALYDPFEKCGYAFVCRLDGWWGWNICRCFQEVLPYASINDTHERSDLFLVQSDQAHFHICMLTMFTFEFLRDLLLRNVVMEGLLSGLRKFQKTHQTLEEHRRIRFFRRFISDMYLGNHKKQRYFRGTTQKYNHRSCVLPLFLKSIPGSLQPQENVMQPCWGCYHWLASFTWF